MQPYRKVRSIRVSWPVAPATVAAAINGDLSAIERDQSLEPLLAIVRADNCLGDFGLYRAVAEIMPCCELFEPQPGAAPTLGTPSETQASTNLMVTLHVDASVGQSELDRVVTQIVAAHPWEVPVIEIAEAVLALRPDQADR